MGNVAEIIKYEGENNVFVWKHPLEDFNSLTQLIVHESQEAIFFMNGQALDLFGPGRYTLETQNIPKLGKLLNRVVGDETPFHSEVYFVNKTEQMAIKWGTDSKVQYMEPTYGFPVSIGACGEMSLRVNDSRKLLVKLVGTESYLGQARLSDFFRAFLMTRVKTYIAKTIKAKAISIFEIDENLTDFSEEIRALLLDDFNDYGITLERFLVTTILKPDGDKQYEKFKELHFRQYADVTERLLQQKISVIDAQTEAQRTVIESQALATKRAQEGYTYQQERGFTVMEKVADNEGSGSDLRNAAMGIGIGFGAGGALGNAMNTITSNTMSGLMTPVVDSPINNASTINNDIPGMINLKTNEQNNNAVSGKTSDSDDDMSAFKKKLDKLVMMKDSGLLSEDEFMAEKQRLLSQI